MEQDHATSRVMCGFEEVVTSPTAWQREGEAGQPT